MSTTAVMQRASGAEWRDRAAALLPRYPLMSTDWDQHADLVEAGIYRVQIRTETPAPAAAPNCENADVPLSPEEEEQLATLF
jgi:hypothetical protein